MKREHCVAIMNAAKRVGVEEAIKRLEGTPPAGSLPASGSGAAERCPDQTRDTCSSSAPPFGGQGTGAVERLLNYLTLKAEIAEKTAAMENIQGRIETAESAMADSAMYYRWASYVRDAIAAPRPQSGADGGERCQACLGNGQRVGPDGYSALVACDHCEGTGSRQERSGPPNVEVSDRPS